MNNIRSGAIVRPDKVRSENRESQRQRSEERPENSCRYALLCFTEGKDVIRLVHHELTHKSTDRAMFEGLREAYNGHGLWSWNPCTWRPLTWKPWQLTWWSPRARSWFRLTTLSHIEFKRVSQLIYSSSLGLSAVSSLFFTPIWLTSWTTTRKRSQSVACRKAAIITALLKIMRKESIGTSLHPQHFFHLYHEKLCCIFIVGPKTPVL